MATNKWAIMGGVALNVEYTRKYAFDATAAAKVTAKLVAIPPPSLFQEAIQADISGRARRLALLTAPRPAPTAPGPGTSPSAGRDGPGTLPPETADDAGFKPLSFPVEEKAGIEYSLDDGMTPPRTGRVSADGILTNRISTRAKSFVVTFADGSEPLELVLDEPTLDADEEEFDEEEFDGDEFDEEVDESSEIWEEEEIDAELDEFSEEDDAEDDEPGLSLIFAEKAGKAYTLDDGIAPEATGVVAEDGTLIHAVSPGATLVKIQFEDDPEIYEFAITS